MDDIIQVHLNDGTNATDGSVIDTEARTWHFSGDFLRCFDSSGLEVLSVRTELVSWVERIAAS